MQSQMINLDSNLSLLSPKETPPLNSENEIIVAPRRVGSVRSGAVLHWMSDLERLTWLSVPQFPHL